jgi:hypothetical protein
VRDVRRAAIGVIAAATLVACRGGASGGDPVDAAASPQASQEPAPIATTTPSGALATGPDAGPPPSPMRADRELPIDTPREPSREKEQARDTPKDARDLLAGWSLQATLRPSDVAAAPRAPEVSERALDLARKKTEARLGIDLSQTRMRITLTSGFVLPADTEIRARLDRYGHVLMLPKEGTYRVAAAGALRAVLGERRLDVAPLSAAEIMPSGEGQRRFNFRTRRLEVTTRAAKATFEIASVKDAGDGGSLVCRALLDLMSASPSTPLCMTDDIPVHAEIRWATKGAIMFDVASMIKRSDLPAPSMATPPATVAYASSPIPAEGAGVLLSRAELASFRSAPVDVPAPDAGAPQPESGLVLFNATDQLRVVWIDGVAVAWLAPGGREELPSLVRGRYVLQWRTFLGDAFDPATSVVAPGTIGIAFGDAGAPR